MNARSVRVIAIAGFASLLASAAAAQLHPGKYRNTITMAGEAPTTGEQCVTQKDIDAGLSGVMQSGQGCKVQNMKNAGGRLSYRTVCAANGVTTTLDTTGTVGADSFALDIGIRTGNETKPETIRVVGKRVGDCK